MKKYNLFILIFIFIVTGCNNKNSSVVKYNNFPIEETLKLTQITLSDTILLNYPWRIAKTDSLIFILDIHPYEYFVQCYSYPDFEYQCSLLKHGQGPGEYTSIDGIQCINDSLFFSSGLQAHFIDIKNINSNNVHVCNIKFDTDNFGFLTHGVKIKNKFYFLHFTGQVSIERLIEFDNNGNFITSFGEIRMDEKQEIDAAIYQGWISHLAGNEEILATATEYGEVIDIYFLNEPRHQLTVKGKGGDPSFIKHNGYGIPDPNGIVGFEDIIVADAHIFALYNGEKGAKEISAGRGEDIFMYMTTMGFH